MLVRYVGHKEKITTEFPLGCGRSAFTHSYTWKRLEEIEVEDHFAKELCKTNPNFVLASLEKEEPIKEKEAPVFTGVLHEAKKKVKKVRVENVITGEAKWQ